MTPSDFLLQLQHAARGIPQPAVKRAGIAYLSSLDRRKPTTADVESVAVALRGAGPTETVKTDEPVGAFHVRDLMSSEIIAARFEDFVGGLRRRVFGKEDRPFRSGRAARRWIAATARKEQDGCPFPSEGLPTSKVKELWRDDLGELVGLSRATGVEINRRLTMTPVCLSYPEGSSRGPRSVFAPFGGKLYRLAKGAKRIAESTGFHEAAVTWWVLLDVRPILPRVTWTAHRHGERDWVEVKFNATDIGWDELREIYRRLRAGSNVRRQRMNELHYRIWQLVRQRGGVPEAGKVEFWKSILDGLREERGPRLPRTWQAIRKAYCVEVARAKKE